MIKSFKEVCYNDSKNCNFEDFRYLGYSKIIFEVDNLQKLLKNNDLGHVGT
jgi:hypothetical protein